MIRNTFWFLSGMAFALVAMIYDGVYGPVTLRLRRKVDPEPGGGWD